MLIARSLRVVCNLESIPVSNALKQQEANLTGDFKAVVT